MLPLLFLACSPDPTDTSGPADSGTGDPTGDPLTIPLAGECPMESHHGAFVVEAYDNYSIVDGSVSDGVVPSMVLENSAEEGDCILWKRNNPYCEPACVSGDTCDFSGECIPYPAAQDLGTVSVRGLTSSVDMEPIVPGYRYFDTDLDYPGFKAGKLVQLTTSGGAYASFTLHAVGVDLLEPTATSWTVTPGTPLSVAWDAPTTTVRSSVRLSLNIDQHGQTPLTLVCHFDDDGAAEVPASVMDALMGAGVTGFPLASIRRQTADSTTVGTGCVDLVLSHDVDIDVTVEGHTPCTSNADCPPGHPCNLAIQTCE